MSAIDLLFDALLEDVRLHAPGTRVYEWFKASARREIERRFSTEDPVGADFGRFGEVTLPYYRMGAVDSLDLFGLDELIIFAFYWSTRQRYRRTVDVGANLGLHTIIMSRCGFSVTAFEPDPVHFAILQRNTAANGIGAVDLRNAAVSTRDGTATFVRVLGNTTGSHLLGTKDSYGERQQFEVRVEEARRCFDGADFIKIDAEGHERDILLSTELDDWTGTDAIVEIGSAENARAIFEHLGGLGVNMFAQRLGWARATRPGEMPTSHRHGSLFISRSPTMPWPRS